MLLLTAGKGPQECAYAVGLALKRLQQECQKSSLKCSIIEAKQGAHSSLIQHVIVSLEGEKEEIVVNQWLGSMLWVCQSPFRKNHKRKNWFFSGQLICSESASSKVDLNMEDIEFSYCRASGAGGQHVNKTDSAVRAVHKLSGVQVRVESERSQHGNKRIAIKLIEFKLNQEEAEKKQMKNKDIWSSHKVIERGSAIRVFNGLNFLE